MTIPPATSCQAYGLFPPVVLLSAPQERDTVAQGKRPGKPAAQPWGQGLLASKPRRGETKSLRNACLAPLGLYGRPTSAPGLRPEGLALG